MMTALARSFGRRILLLMLPMLPVSASPVVAQEWLSARPDGHAPLGVMGDHTHERGEVMLSYRFMPMQMDGNRDGTDSLTPADVLTQFPVTPLRMPMSMHMFGVMVAPTEKLTIMGMVPVINASMDHMTRPGSLFTTSAAGVGDIKLSGLVRLFNSHHRTAHLHGQRLAVEFIKPFWQDLKGPQLEDDWELVIGWQYAFRAWGAS